MMAFKANQQRGSWIAELESGFDELGVDHRDPFVAVVIEDENGRVEGRSRIYRHKASADMGAWWDRASSARWKSLMLSGKPILLRRGMDRETKTAGPKIAFFQIKNLVFEDEGFQFEIIQRLAECS